MLNKVTKAVTLRRTIAVLVILLIGALIVLLRNQSARRHTNSSPNPSILLHCELSTSITPNREVLVTITVHNRSSQPIGLSATSVSPSHFSQFIIIFDITDQAPVYRSAPFVNRIPTLFNPEELIYIDSQDSIQIDINITNYYALSHHKYKISIDGITYDYQNNRYIQLTNTTSSLIDLTVNN